MSFPLNWRVFPDIDDVSPLSFFDDAPFLLAASRALKASGQGQEKVGVCLLHHHFDVHDDEVLLEQLTDGGQILCTPSGRKEAKWPISFCRAEGEARPFVFSKTPVKPFDAQRVIDNIEHSIWHRYERRFGFVNLGRLDDDAIYIETTDSVDRSIILRPGSFEDVSAKDIQTVWKIESPEELEVILGCRKKSETWCDRYCRTSCRESTHGGHSSNHRGSGHSRESRSVHYS